ncbi:MAG: RluA family pseudouridine synthase [Ruminococcaceae bacterium]|nr:RluA family pseudouridine synthase [Oscillospiraceae bacterium]
MVEENDNIETVLCEVGGDRLDVFVSNEFSVSRSRASTLINDTLVSVNGQVKKKNYIVQDGDFVEVSMPDIIEYDVQAENLKIDIVYEDNDLLVVNKPQNMVVHPSPGHNSGTLVNALMYHVKFLSSVNGVSRPGILHRIDKDTSGLLLVAKNDKSHLFLSEQIKNHTLDRFYEAVVHGTPKEEKGFVNFSIGRDKKDRKKMAAYPADSTQAGIRNACTHYEVLDSFKNFSHIRLKLETGRTHQIRVHMKAIGHPVVGDPLYSSPKLESFGLQGQCLHARAIGFIHPTTGEHMYFESELPDYFVKVLKKLK